MIIYILLKIVNFVIIYMAERNSLYTFVLRIDSSTFSSISFNSINVTKNVTKTTTFL